MPCGRSASASWAEVQVRSWPSSSASTAVTRSRRGWSGGGPGRRRASALQAKTGQPAEHFADVLAKEGPDNGLDAAEEAGVAPAIHLRYARSRRRLRLGVTDNGSGISPEV